MSPRTHLATLATLAIGLAAGCRSLTDWGFPSPSPSVPCYFQTQVSAPMFHVTAPATASAGATFSLMPWVNVDPGSWGTPDELIPESFKATVDEASKTLTVSGLVTRREVNPEGRCAVPMLAFRNSAATVSVVASASAGTYTIVLPGPVFTNRGYAPYGPTDPLYGAPAPRATASITLE